MMIPAAEIIQQYQYHYATGQISADALAQQVYEVAHPKEKLNWKQIVALMVVGFVAALANPFSSSSNDR